MLKKKLRSQEWFDNPKEPGLTALYLEKYLNYGLTRKELQSGRPIIGIAQSGSDLSPCNRHFQKCKALKWSHLQFLCIQIPTSSFLLFIVSSLFCSGGTLLTGRVY